jgi:hypothetical protein
MNNDQTVTISLESLNQVYRYLATRPYAEVANLVALLQAAKPLVLETNTLEEATPLDIAQ